MLFIPSRLTLARRMRGMNQSMLAQCVGVSLRAVTAWERGTNNPERNITKLAEVLKVQEAFFSRAPVDELTPNSVSFRKLSKLRASQREQALAAGEVTLEFADWLSSEFNLPVVAIPEYTSVDPETAAMAVRAEWGCGEMPIRNMIHLLESRGVRVFSLPIPSRLIDAYSFWRDGIPYIFLNTEKSGEHRRFDAAHELGHLILHRREELHKRDIEHEANEFASALLMPRASVLATVPRGASLTTLLKLKRRWNASLISLIYRAHRLNLLTDWQYRSLMIEASEKGYRTKEPDPCVPETSQVLAKILDALRKDGDTLSDVARKLSVYPDDLKDRLFGLTLTSVDGRGRNSARSAPELRLVGPVSDLARRDFPS